MSNENDTSSTSAIARDVINSTPADAPARIQSNDAHNRFAARNPAGAMEEFADLVGDDVDHSFTRRVAAAHIARTDPRKVVVTHQGMVRREHDDNGNRTSRVAREMADLHAAFEGREVDPQLKRNIALHRFAAGINTNTHEATLPSGGSLAKPMSDEWNASADAIIEMLAQRVRDRRDGK